TGLGDRALRWYLNRHAARMFAGSARTSTPPVSKAEPPRAAEGAVTRSAEAFARAERPLLVIGSQALLVADRADEIAAAVTQLGIPVYLSGMARGLLGPNHPLQMRHARRNALRESDCVLLAGVPCDFRLDYGRHVRRSATLIAANRSAKDARLNRRPTITALGDAGLMLETLAQRVGDRARRPEWAAQLRARDDTREKEIDAQAAAAGEHVNPIAFFRALDRVAGDNAVMVADGGDFVATASYIVRPRGPLAWLDPGAFGTLGVGAGFALGAQLVRPDSEVWLIWGDGASGYGLVEFDTFVRHGIPVIAVVGNDASWAQIAREQVKMFKDDVATVLARTDYHAVAQGFGAAGLVARRTEEVEPVLRQAREIARGGQPVLVNVWLDRTDFREGSISM
ncbi:MAG TPA: thiamine pyrophosphate-dependent enzyme, partial [Burkholderiaceae bacterium]|nr:thiamine pyrophosphate-dependent enzyme [Burkholderiaceae bacterium]